MLQLPHGTNKSDTVRYVSNETVSNVYNLPLILQAIAYLHAVPGFPVKETWVRAINNGNYVTWSGLTTEMVNKHFPKSVEMQKGHLKNSARM